MTGKISEGFDALKKKLMSVSGRYAAPAPVYYRPRVVAPVVYRPVVRPYGYGYRHHHHGPRPVPYYAPGAYGVGPAATVGYGP